MGIPRTRRILATVGAVVVLLLLATPSIPGAVARVAPTPIASAAPASSNAPGEVGPALPPRADDWAAPDATGPVNPQAVYRREPSPMAVADYGVTYGGTAYAYNTTTFIGTAWVQSLSAYGGAGANSSGHYICFQLNVEMVLFDPATGTNYTYWVQNVVSIST
ncbi:MAG: thermopsin family protease, partial [Thermoplasmata archaeon]